MRYSLAVAVLLGLVTVTLCLTALSLWGEPMSYGETLPAALVFALPVFVLWRRSRGGTPGS